VRTRAVKNDENRDFSRPRFTCKSQASEIVAAYGMRLRVQRVSSDYEPPPVINKKTEPSSIDQSVRASWAVLQKP